ncbi:MAG: PHP domain-containing protein [Bacteroidota bacterium]|nr:PHP domain-containing protein [Bacteroidota bacterium]MDW8138255.1 PHP domain-containing protein [Bacteroidota bacterium]
MRSRERADLHTHTTCSDGRLTPRELVRRAAQVGLGAVAITDHDTVAGLEEAYAESRSRGLELIPGLELSVRWVDRDLHLLAYGIDPDHGDLRKALEALREARLERLRQMVRNLGEIGIRISLDRVLEVAGSGVVGRPHLAQVLVEAGWARTPAEAFARYLGSEGPVAAPRVGVPLEEALRLIHRAGGVAVIAHPGPRLAGAPLAALIRAGLDGIEVVHPRHSWRWARYYGELAREAGLIATGGSDYHGGPEEEAYFGSVVVSCAIAEQLRHRAAYKGGATYVRCS